MTPDEAVRFVNESPELEPPALQGALRVGSEAAGELTAREIEVLNLLARGLTNAEIAAELVLSRRTVHAHLQSIYSKLGVNSRTSAVREARSQGVIS